MNSSVTLLSDTSVMSSSCFPMSESRRSKGPLKLLRLTEKPETAASLSASATTTAALGRCATGYQLSGELAVGIRCGVIGREAGDRRASDAGIRELDGAADDGLEDAIAEGRDHPLEHLPRMQRARVVHRRQDAVEF